MRFLTVPLELGKPLRCLLPLPLVGLVSLAVVGEGRLRVLDQHCLRLVATCPGLLLLVLLGVELLLGLVWLGRQQLLAMHAVTGAAHGGWLLVAPPLAPLQLVQVHKPIHHGRLEVPAHKPVHWPLLKWKSKPLQLPVCQLKWPSALRHLLLATLVAFTGGLDRNPSLLDAPAVARAVLLVPLFAVWVTLKHTLVDPPACLAWHLAFAACPTGWRLLLRHVRFAPLTVLHLATLAV